MGSYLQQYGVSEQHRNRILRNIIIASAFSAMLAIIAYLLLKDYPEQQKVKRFLNHVNARDFHAAYREWGCDKQHPCPNYDYSRFLGDWGHAGKADSNWVIRSTDSCKYFFTANVQAPGAEMQSVSVQRADNSMSFAPSAECQEPKWRWRQFFQQYFGKPEPPPKPGRP